MRIINLQNARRWLASIMALMYVIIVSAQTQVTVSGIVSDDTGEPLIGATVALKNNPRVATATDMDGKFSLKVDKIGDVLRVSYIGMRPLEVKSTTGVMTITLETDQETLDEVVVVGYGQQKKASLVGAITQTSGEVLQRAAGIHDIGAALTGNLPGVVTTASSGMPGEEEPEIVVRGASSWNSSSPLVLVDGIERPMTSVDISSVKSISVLKDASATAVYGVKGANGVILITTRRGEEGGAKIDVGFTATLKTASKLPSKLDSYGALAARNRAIEHELAVSPDSWAYMTPQEILEKYRNPLTLEESERYPNVDWQDVLFKDHAMSYNGNVSVSGGTKFVKYFAVIDFVSEGDLFKSFDNGRDYNSGFDYNRINARSNLDFSITPTTTFKVNLAGSNGQRRSPWVRDSSSLFDSSDWSASRVWAGAYSIAPDVFLPQYSDGSWGYYPANSSQVANSVEQIALLGAMKTTTTRINTDFTLEQDLSFLTKGLNFRGMVAWDNMFVESHRGIKDLDNAPQRKWIDPATGIATYQRDYEGNSLFDYMPGLQWTTEGGTVQNRLTQRHLNYQLQLNWARDFGRHNVTATGVWTRQEDAYGSEIARYREDWVFRTTYNYANKYFVEYNGAYNGSEKFGTKFRFGFFNSGAAGWRISEEKFMNFSRNWLDELKVRFSYGEIGDDTGDRWLYMDQWAFGGNTSLDIYNTAGTSPYAYYYMSALGNPDVHWEKVTKTNFGIDYSFLNRMFAGSVEIFKDRRKDILIKGSDRSVPSYFGQTPPTSNLGKAETSGYELELKFNKSFGPDWHIWANLSMTHAANKVISRDDPELMPAYQKNAGYAINQTHSYIDAGYLNSFDDIYGSPVHSTNDSHRLPGDYYIIDFNGDGVIDSKDSVPYGFTSVPQNTYNATVGFEWRGFSCFAQFYGVNNVTRLVQLESFSGELNNVYDLGSWWTASSGDGDVTVPRWQSTTSTFSKGTMYLYDASYIRLKNVELAYTWGGKDWIRSIGLNSLKVFLNGNNLWVWSRMPDDRESNFSGASNQGAYPTMRRFNLGVKFSL